MKKTRIVPFMGLALALAGCATDPKEIDAAYVSPVKYKDYDCDQIALEMEHVSQRTGLLYRRLKKESDADAGQMAAGILLFWPTLFFLEGGDGPEAAEFARLKGEFEALRTVSVQKRCDIDIEPLDKVIDDTPEEASNTEKKYGKEYILYDEKYAPSTVRE